MQKKILSLIKSKKNTALVFFSKTANQFCDLSIYYILCIACLFVSLGFMGLSGINFYQKESLLSMIAEEVEDLKEKSSQVANQNQRKQEFKEQFKLASSDFIDQQIHPISCLQEEVSFLQTIQKLPGFTSFGPINKRIQLLNSQYNKPIFIKGNDKQKLGFRETHYHLSHPIEVNEEDIQLLLSKIEGIQIADHEKKSNRPQLIVKQFCMTRKNSPNLSEAFEIDMKLLQREMIK